MERRIVSLVPSLTELVFWLGRGSWLVGRTRFCVEPGDEVGAVPVVGGTKNPRVERVAGLKPDLVLANREENRKEDVEALRERGLEVLLTDPDTLAGAVAMIREVGGLLGARNRAEELCAEVEEMLRETPVNGPRVFVAIWREPLMGLGAETYGHDLLRVAGATNVLGHLGRYPEVTIDEVRGLKPDVVLLPNEPYPFDGRHLGEFDGIAPAKLLDGKLLWWYGPRIPGAIRELRRLFREGDW